MCIRDSIKALFEKYPALEAMCTSSDGNIYALAGWWGDINDYVPDYLYIRQDWLDNLGLEMPKTVDELYDVLAAFKEQDANGNGNPNDEIPMATKNGIKQLYYLMTGFGYDTNSLWYTDDSGKVHYAAVEDQYKEMLAFLNKCYSEGLISDDLDGTLLTQNITCLLYTSWAAAYDTGDVNMRSRALHDQWQKQLDCRQLVLDGGRPVEENLERIRMELDRCV